MDTNYYNKYVKYKNKYLETRIKIGGTVPKEIYFIRHGRTDWNKEGKTQGQEADILLNEEGIEQARKTGLYLKNYRTSDKEFDCIISSPLQRASKTAKIIGKELGINKSQIIYLDALKEVKKGNMSGLTKHDEPMVKFNNLVKEEIQKINDPIEKYNKLHNPCLSHQFFENIITSNELPITGQETFDELDTRINEFIEYLKNTDCTKIIVVSHSGLLGVLLQKMFNLNVLPTGDTSNGGNCTICYCTLNNDVFTMITPSNTEHLGLY
jgi:broad specificity phosphatase PhoE